jgi:hypothetical protein
MLGRELDRRGLSLSIGINQGGRHEIPLSRSAAEVAEGQWVLPCGIFYGSPEVDDLHMIKLWEICNLMEILTWKRRFKRSGASLGGRWR